MSSTEIKNSDELRRSRVGCVVKGRGRKGYVPVPKRERKKGRLSACSISEHGTKGRVWISLTALGQFCHDRSAHGVRSAGAQRLAIRIAAFIASRALHAASYVAGLCQCASGLHHIESPLWIESLNGSRQCMLTICPKAADWTPMQGLCEGNTTSRIEQNAKLLGLRSDPSSL